MYEKAMTATLVVQVLLGFAVITGVSYLFLFLKHYLFTIVGNSERKIVRFIDKTYFSIIIYILRINIYIFILIFMIYFPLSDIFSDNDSGELSFNKDEDIYYVGEDKVRVLVGKDKLKPLVGKEVKTTKRMKYVYLDYEKTKEESSKK